MEWISVEDRLPEELETVLFASIAGNVNQGFYESVDRNRVFINKLGEIEYPKVAGGFWYRDRFNDFIPGVLVTHWMPLPKPPKIEKRGNT